VRSLFVPSTRLQICAEFWKGKPTSRGERLQEERTADKASDEELRQRYAGDDEADP